MKKYTIPKKTDKDEGNNYSFLRRMGMKHIEKMAHQLWTDYNTHDPGITILESLCYAITDLEYRIAAPVPDLIATPPNSTKKCENTFPTAKNILTTNAITENDYRKLFIDIPNVKNAFIRAVSNEVVHQFCSLQDEVTNSKPQGKLSYKSNLLPHYKHQGQFKLQGLNKVFFELDTDIQQLDIDDPIRVNKTDEVLSSIRTVYHANRNLCEDLVEVKEVGSYNFLVCGDIEIDSTADAINTVVDILFAIQQHLAPSVKRYTLEDLLEKDLSTDEIYNGPILTNGFITDEELYQANFKTEVRLSDLIQIIAETPGVKRIKDLSMNSCPCPDEVETEEECKPLENPWKICFPSGFDKIIRLCLNKSVLNIFKDVIPIDTDLDEIKEALRKKFEDYNRSQELTYDDLEIESGEYQNNGEYFSVQNDLPRIYGVDEIGLSPALPVERHAQALQLKGYLSFFDQILATYFSHLKNVSQLLSADLHGGNTYYLNELQDIKDFEKLLKDEATYTQDSTEILGSLEDFTDRKGRFLDHLLARFSEEMNQYMFLMIDLFGSETKDASLWHKAKLLEEYQDLSYHRANAFNYYGKEHGVWDTLNVSGFQHRIARLLGIRDYSRRDLTSYSFEFYPEADADPTDEWRWRIRHTDGRILFSSSMHYETTKDAEDELWKTISIAWDEANYDLLPTYNKKKWYFNLVNKNKEVIARHIQFYTDKSKAEKDIKDFAKYIFDKITDEGLYLFENILLRPDRSDSNADSKFVEICVDEDCTQCKPEDPYSFRITIVLPGWTKRFSNMSFRDFAENAIRAELPAHILCRICWIGSPLSELEVGEESQMNQLEELYHLWLGKKMTSPLNQSNNQYLKPLVDLIQKLDTIYPEGTLHDCNKDGESKTSIILNRSSLGELKNTKHGSE